MMYARGVGIFLTSMLGLSSVVAAQDGSCHVGAFTKSIGYDRILVAHEGAALATARLGNETRCEYRSVPAACLNDSLRKVRAYRSLRRSADQDDVVAIEEVDRALSQLIDVLSALTISYTVVAGRLYGVTFKDIEGQASLFGRIELSVAKLQEKEFRNAVQQFCDLGKYDDNTFSLKMDQAIAEHAARVRSVRLKKERLQEDSMKDICRRLANGGPQTGMMYPYSHSTENMYREKCGVLGFSLPPPQ